MISSTGRVVDPKIRGLFRLRRDTLTYLAGGE